jgi:hypothetical protein
MEKIEKALVDTIATTALNDFARFRKLLCSKRIYVERPLERGDEFFSNMSKSGGQSLLRILLRRALFFTGRPHCKDGIAGDKKVFINVYRGV